MSAIVFNGPTITDPYGMGALGKAFGDAMGESFIEQRKRNKEASALRSIFGVNEDDDSGGDTQEDIKKSLMSGDPQQVYGVLAQVLSHPELSDNTKKMTATLLEKVMQKPQDNAVKIDSWYKKTGEQAPPEYVPKSMVTARAAEMLSDPDNPRTLQKPTKERVPIFRLKTGSDGTPVPGKKAGSRDKWSWESEGDFEKRLNADGLTVHGEGDEVEKKTQTIIVNPQTGQKKVWAGKAGDEIPDGWMTESEWEKHQGRQERREEREERDTKIKSGEIRTATTAANKMLKDPTNYDLSDEDQQKYEENPKKFVLPPTAKLKDTARDEIQTILDPVGLKIEERTKSVTKKTKSTFLGIGIPGTESEENSTKYGYTITKDRSDEPKAKKEESTGKNANHNQAVEYLKQAKNRDEAKQRIKDLKKRGWSREALESIAQDAGF